METEPIKGYGVRGGNDKRRWLWWELFTSKKYANDCILIRYSKLSAELISPDVVNSIRRDAELRRIKKKFSLKVVKVKMIEDYD